MNRLRENIDNAKLEARNCTYVSVTVCGVAYVGILGLVVAEPPPSGKAGVKPPKSR